MGRGQGGGRGRSLSAEEWTQLLIRYGQEDIGDLVTYFGISEASIERGVTRHWGNPKGLAIKHGPAKGQGGRRTVLQVSTIEQMAQYQVDNRRRPSEVPARELLAKFVPKRLKEKKVKRVDPVTAQVTVSYPWRVVHVAGPCTVRRQLKKLQGMSACRPAAKPVYSEKQRQERCAYAAAGALRPPGFFDPMCFTDEVQLIWARGDELRRLQGCRVRFVYRRRGERFHPDCCKPRGAQHGMDGVHLKFFVSVAQGCLIMCDESTPYKAYSQTPKGQLDQHSYAVYLRDLAASYRETFGLSADDPVPLVQDGWSIHLAPAARQAERDHNIKVVEGQPSISPDLNPIENIFARLIERIEAIYTDDAKSHVSVDEFKNDVMDVLVGLAADGTIERTCSDASMRARCAAVLANQGGPTPY